MAQMIEEQSSGFETQTLGIFRTSTTVKGGRRFSFGALVVCGDGKGRVGYGHGKSKEVPSAVEKAEKAARRALVRVPRIGSTIPHEVEGRFGASCVRLIPASPGTGVIAGGTVRAVLESAGVTDCLTKCYGSTNRINTIRAVFDGLARLRGRAAVEEVRGLELGVTDIENKIERGARFMPKAAAGEKMRGPVNTVGQEQRRGGRGGRSGGGGGGGGRGGRGGPGSSGGSGGQPSAGAPAGGPESGGG